MGTIEKALRKCICQYCDKFIQQGEKRVNLSTIPSFGGFAHPVCAVRMVDKRIQRLQSFRKDFVNRYRTELVVEEL